MKKILTVFLTLGILLSLAVTVNAAPETIAIPYGEAKIDGVMDEAYTLGKTINVKKFSSIFTGTGSYGEFYALWNEKGIYIFAEVVEKTKETDGVNPWDNDNIEYYIDEDNPRNTAVDQNDGQYRIGLDGEMSFGLSASAEFMQGKVKQTKTGYNAEVFIAFKEEHKAGDIIGLDFIISDRRDGERRSAACFKDTTGNGWLTTANYGTAVLCKNEVGEICLTEKSVYTLNGGLLPLRAVAEDLGAEISYEEKTDTAKVSLGTDVIYVSQNEIKIGDKTFDGGIQKDGRFYIPKEIFVESGIAVIEKKDELNASFISLSENHKPFKTDAKIPADGEKIKDEKLKTAFHGEVEFIVEEEYLVPRRFNKAQVKSFEEMGFVYQPRRTTGIKLVFETDSKYFAFDYNAGYVTGNSCEVYVDGEKQGGLNFETDFISGVYYHSLDGGKHKVEIYFPNSQMGIKNFTVEKGKLFETVPEKEEILFLGDSITEGIGIANISKTYPQIVAEALDMTLYNQGVASYTHDERTIDEIGEADPEIVFVAMGVNEVFQSNMEENLKGKVEKYYEKLLKTFPDSKIYVMTPLTAFDRDYKKVQVVREIIKEVVSKYEGITVINGEEILSPQMCFEDRELLSDYVHPSDKGAKVIAEKLIEIMK
ncbi:MAG: hypothetical protein J5984_04305 [Clostridia bacterium]|nr:hypothetical protein [Clostridia bacterium]